MREESTKQLGVSPYNRARATPYIHIKVMCGQTSSRSIVRFRAKLPAVTLSLTDDEKFVAISDGTSNWPSQPSIYIGADVGELKSVGFTSDNGRAAANSTHDGFNLFGGWSFNNVNSGAIEMKFVASPTDETNVYQYVPLPTPGSADS